MGNLVGGKCLAAFLPSSNVESVLCLQPLSKYYAMREGQFYLSITTEKRVQQSTKENCDGKEANATTKANSHSISCSTLGSVGWHVCIRRLGGKCQHERSLGHAAKQHRARNACP